MSKGKLRKPRNKSFKYDTRITSLPTDQSVLMLDLGGNKYYPDEIPVLIQWLQDWVKWAKDLEERDE